MFTFISGVLKKRSTFSEWCTAKPYVLDLF